VNAAPRPTANSGGKYGSGCRAGALALILLAGGRAEAAAARGAIAVTATVDFVARVNSMRAPDAVQLTAADVRRGYVDIAGVTELWIFSNSRSGFILEVDPVSPLFRRLTVHGLGDDVVLGIDGGEIVQRWVRTQTAHLALTFRFTLVPGLRPGTYPWPLQLAVRPLRAT